MEHRTTRRPLEAHSFRGTVLTAAVTALAVVVTLAALSAPGTTATVTATVVAVLALQRGRRALATRRGTGSSGALGTPRHAG